MRAGTPAIHVGQPCPAIDELVSHKRPRPGSHTFTAAWPTGVTGHRGMVDVPFSRRRRRAQLVLEAGGRTRTSTHSGNSTRFTISPSAETGNLVIGEVITSEGLVPEGDIKRLSEFGRTLQNRFAKLAGENLLAAERSWI